METKKTTEEEVKRSDISMINWIFLVFPALATHMIFDWIKFQKGEKKKKEIFDYVFAPGISFDEVIKRIKEVDEGGKFDVQKNKLPRLSARKQETKHTHL